MKASANTQTEEQGVKEGQSWGVDNWMKVLFIDESRICIDQGEADSETFVYNTSLGEGKL